MGVESSSQSKPQEPAGSQLAERLRGVHVGTRHDLEVSRHLFRGEPAYVIRDPLTFESYRLDRSGYAIFVALQRDLSLGEIFEKVVEQGCLSRQDEETFYQTILTLHRLNFLNLPISDDKMLYQRYLAKKQARTREKLLGFLFLRIPLINPDAFLRRTLRYVSWLFSKPFFFVWLAMMACAAFIVVKSFNELIEPIQGVLVARNLPVIWFALIALKIVHEFGHAYACKRLGGHVPEMGVFLIVFTPLAYVDATSAWGFSKKLDRLVVGLGGMYFESMAAALAVFVWAFTGPGPVHDLAYNIIFLAGVATVLFNINPLLRYDGYYVLSDLLEVPNLRQQANRYVTGLLKRAFLGLPSGFGNRSVGMRALLLTYGLAASAYRVTIVLAISAAIAMKFFLVGIALGAFYIGQTLIGLLVKATKYLWFAPEAAPVRVRAVAVSLLMLIGLPAAVLTVPVKPPVRAAGTLSTETEHVIRAEVDGFIERVDASVGESVSASEPLVQLNNDAYTDAMAQARAQLEAASIRRKAYQAEELAKALQEQERMTAYRHEVARRRQELDRLTIRAGMTGRLVDTLTHRDIGRYVRRGDPIGTVGAGPWQAKALLTEQDMADAQPEVGGTVQVRVAAAPDRVIEGYVVRIVPKGSKLITMPSLTQLGGGGIAVDPSTFEASQPYFEVTVEFDPLTDVSMFQHGMTCTISPDVRPETLAKLIERQVRRFLNRLLQG